MQAKDGEILLLSSGEMETPLSVGIIVYEMKFTYQWKHTNSYIQYNIICTYSCIHMHNELAIVINNKKDNSFKYLLQRCQWQSKEAMLHRSWAQPLIPPAAACEHLHVCSFYYIL